MRLSDEIKLELMKYYRFERNYNLVCTEGINNADVNAWNGNQLVEVEVKISKADFKKEFLTEDNGKNHWKIYKHTNYANPHEHVMNGYIVPHRFYFCVPVALGDWAKDYLEDKKSKYGLLVYDKTRWAGQTHIVTYRPAKALHREELHVRTKTLLMKRASSELITAKENLYSCQRALDELRQDKLYINE